MPNLYKHPKKNFFSSASGEEFEPFFDIGGSASERPTESVFQAKAELQTAEDAFLDSDFDIDMQRQMESELQRRVKKEIEKIREDVTQQAYDEGMKKGVEDGRKSFEQEMSHCIQGMKDQFQKFLENAASDCIAFESQWVQALQTLLHRLQLSVPREVSSEVVTWLKEATAYSSKKSKLKIFMAKEAIEKVKAIQKDEIPEYFEFIPAHDLVETQIRVEGDGGGFFFSIDEQIAKFDEILSKYIQKPKKAEGASFA